MTLFMDISSACSREEVILSLCPDLFSLSEDEAFELCLGLQTLQELKVRSLFALLIFSESYRVHVNVFLENLLPEMVKYF